MSDKRIAHRAEFPVRCACGITYNTDDSHIGRALRCRCGRTITIARPPDEYGARARARGEPKAPPKAPPKASSGASPIASAKRQAGASWRRVRKGATTSARTLLTGSVLAMGSARPLRRWSARLSWALLVLVVVVWVALFTLSERMLPFTLLAYGPRFLLLLLPLALLPFVLVTARAALLPLALATLVIVGPIMGGRVSTATLLREVPPAPPAGAIRIVTFNSFGGAVLSGRLDELLALRPDVVTLQECGERLRDALDSLRGWHVERHRSLCTLSRWPIASADSMPRNDFERLSRRGAGGSGLLVRHLIATPRGPLVVANLHLETARKGLEGFTDGRGLVPDDLGDLSRLAGDAADASSARLEVNTIIRARESERASLYAIRGDKSIPTFVAGDFNLPVESSIWRRYWSGYTDAFESRGTGFGWSKQEGRLLRIRIDHILGSDAAPRPIGAWVGPDWGSDHRPVIADYRWP